MANKVMWTETRMYVGVTDADIANVAELQDLMKPGDAIYNINEQPVKRMVRLVSVEPIPTAKVINYGTPERKAIFERVFWSDSDRSHSAFQSFVDSCSPLVPLGSVPAHGDEQLRRDWAAFQAGWNARK